MPFRVIENEAFGRIRTIGVDQGQQLAVDSIECARLGVTTVLIQAVEFGRQLARAREVPREEQLNHIVRNVHAPGCVDARCDAEANLRRGWCAVQRNFGELHQRTQSRLDRIRKRRQT